MKKVDKKTKKQKTITFQPTQDVLKLLGLAVEITGKNQSKIINEAIHRKLPDVIKEMEVERERAKKALLGEIKNPPDTGKGK